MCGRYVSATPPDQIAAYFGADALGETLAEPSYNVAPTTQVPVVYEPRPTDEQPESPRTLDLFKWGLIPFWAKDEKIGNRMINARSETAAEKNSFKRSLAGRRCIIPADGFYEWKKLPDSKTKLPMYITRNDGALFAFAGLHDSWRGPDRDLDPLRSCTILTTTANEKMSEVHDRMPVMLPPSAWDEWLDPTNADVDALARFFVPSPPELISLTPVSTAVNSSRNRGAHLIEPLDDEVLAAIVSGA